MPVAGTFIEDESEEDISEDETGAIEAALDVGTELAVTVDVAFWQPPTKKEAKTRREIHCFFIFIYPFEKT
jgi:hypothetical protein